jgi:hypothetical protein
MPTKERLVCNEIGKRMLQEIKIFGKFGKICNTGIERLVGYINML